MYVVEDELGHFDEKFAKIKQIVLSIRSDPDPDPVPLFRIRPARKGEGNRQKTFIWGGGGEARMGRVVGGGGGGGV